MINYGYSLMLSVFHNDALVIVNSIYRSLVVPACPVTPPMSFMVSSNLVLSVNRAFDLRVTVMIQSVSFDVRHGWWSSQGLLEQWAEWLASSFSRLPKIKYNQGKTRKHEESLNTPQVINKTKKTFHLDSNMSRKCIDLKVTRAI